MKSLLVAALVLSFTHSAFAKKHEQQDQSQKCYWVPTMNGNEQWGHKEEMDLKTCKHKLQLVKFKRPHGAVCKCEDEIPGNGHGH